MDIVQEATKVFHNDLTERLEEECVTTEEIPFYRCDSVELFVVSRFTVLLGQTIPNVGDVIKHWENDIVGETHDNMEILPDNTKAIRILKVKKIEPLTTGGYNPEGIIMTIEGELILNS